MRILVLSDVHSNLTALEAVLQDAGPVDGVWCLGDLVGYGPDPNECVQRVRGLPNLTCLMGNHDRAALGEIPLSRFNSDARQAVAWTMEALSESSRQFLAALPSMHVNPPFTLAHGSPREPIWEYITDPYIAQRNFDSFKTDFCLVGHSHVQLVFHLEEPDHYPLPLPPPNGRPFPLRPRMILNPGSVGQPRDMDPRAAYALLDTEALTWEARRVSYDVTEVQLRILESGLPERQAIRLVGGW